MQKIYMAIIAAAAAVAVGVIAYTVVSSTGNEKTADTIVVSVEKATVNHNDTQTWHTKGLPPNAAYAVTLRLADTALVVSTGTADANGEASGSFLVEPNLPLGTVVLRVELASDSSKFGEFSLNILP